MRYDVIIIGGSYAGLAAAMPLARARRKVLIIDEGQRRNRFAAHSHGFLTQDGMAPDVIAARAREQLLAYPSVTWLSGRAVSAGRSGQVFSVTVEGESKHEASRIILAAGVTDQLPDIPGLAERWGKHVFHCPYCHGYELSQGQIGVLATSELAMHQALLLPDWGSTTLFLNQVFEPNPSQLEQLVARGVALNRAKVARIDGNADVLLADGGHIRLDGLFVATRLEVTTPIPAMLGCEFDEGVFGRVIKTDAMKMTSVPGVYACGDIARFAGSVTLAVGDGNLAGLAAHRSLIFEQI